MSSIDDLEKAGSIEHAVQLERQRTAGGHIADNSQPIVSSSPKPSRPI